MGRSSLIEGNITRAHIYASARTRHKNKRLKRVANEAERAHRASFVTTEVHTSMPAHSHIRTPIPVFMYTRVAYRCIGKRCSAGFCWCCRSYWMCGGTLVLCPFCCDCRCCRYTSSLNIFVSKPNSKQAFPSANSHIQELKPKSTRTRTAAEKVETDNR